MIKLSLANPDHPAHQIRYQRPLNRLLFAIFYMIVAILFYGAATNFNPPSTIFVIAASLAAPACFMLALSFGLVVVVVVGRIIAGLLVALVNVFLWCFCNADDLKTYSIWLH